jgi:hypothetical protein
MSKLISAAVDALKAAVDAQERADDRPDNLVLQYAATVAWTRYRASRKAADAEAARRQSQA